MLYVVFSEIQSLWFSRVLFVVYLSPCFVIGFVNYLSYLYLSTCSPTVLILVPDSQYTSLVLASYWDFVLAHSTKILSD
jgi:hypothetical protein